MDLVVVRIIMVVPFKSLANEVFLRFLVDETGVTLKILPLNRGD